MSDQFATYDAAYLVGALTPADRSAFEAHLADCAGCRRSVNQLAGMPGLLAALTPDQARAAGDPPPEVPETLLPRLLAEVQRTRFRRRMSMVVVGVAAAAVLAIALVVGLRGSPATEQAVPRIGVAQPMTPISPNLPVSATARLSETGWGTHVTVHCVYRGSDELPGALTYTMVVVDKSGGTQQIAAWVAKAGVPIVVDGSTSVQESQISSIQVRTTEGQPILTLTL